MAYPKITIVTPVFNGKRFIEETINSILEQGYPNLEYIIVDGGSTDGTLETIKKYEKDIALLISEKDKGMYDALNKGFKRSTGELLCWLNADDKLHPKSLFIAAEIFVSLPEVEWLTGVPNNFDAEGRTVEVFAQRKWSKYQYLMEDYYTIQQESVIFKRSLFEKAGGRLDETMKYAGDFEMWMRFFRTGAKLYSTDILFGGFRRHDFGQLTSAINEYRKEVIDVYKKLEWTEEEKQVTQKIRRMEKWHLKIPFLRGKMGWNDTYLSLFDFPSGIRYDHKGKRFFLSGKTDK